MNDVLVPLAQRYHAALVASVGFQSVTSAVDLVAGRVALSGKPVRIFYLSDFDPAGDAMAPAVARQIEFWRAQYAPQADIKLTPLALTLAQVEQYQLPTIPIKDSDTRKASFKERRGSDATELDALEALIPGTLARLVDAALRPYWDRRLFFRCQAVARDAEAQVQADWEATTEDLVEELRDIAQEVRLLVAPYAAQLTQLAASLQADLAPFAERLEALADAVQEEQEAFAPALPTRATPDVDPGEDADWLFDSARSYLDQLAVYKARRAGPCGDQADEDDDAGLA